MQVVLYVRAARPAYPGARRGAALHPHPVRLGVLARLHRLGPVGALVDELGVGQSVPSHHLGHLRKAWLVVGERDDRRVVYHMHDAHVRHWVQETLSHADLDPACGHEGS